MERFWNIKATDNGAEVRITGDIVDDTDVYFYEFFGIPCASPNMFRNELKKFKGQPVSVWIDSYGGSVYAATGIYNALREHGNVTTIIDGKAMSAGFTIALAGDTVKMSMGAMAMAHNPLCDPGMANADELRRVADAMDKVKDTMLNIYQAKSNLPRETLSAIMSAETYMTAQDAKELGFVDEIYDNGPRKAAAKSYARGSIVNYGQLDADKIREIMAQKAKKEPPAGMAANESQAAASDGGISLPADNGGASQPAADISQPDGLKEQRSQFDGIKRKILEAFEHG